MYLVVLVQQLPLQVFQEPLQALYLCTQGHDGGQGRVHHSVMSK